MTGPRTSRRAPRDPDRRASSLIAKLRADVYAEPEWIMIEEVRTSTGVPESLRRADALAVKMTPANAPWRIEAFEVKLTKKNLDEELEDPAKSAAFALFATCFFLVVPAPRKIVVPDLDRVPEMWGILEVGTGGVVPIRPAIERRDVEEPTRPFLRAILRSASRGSAVADEDGAPLMTVTALDGRFAVLSCTHRILRPLTKKPLPRLPCWRCAEERVGEGGRRAPGPGVAGCQAPTERPRTRLRAGGVP